MHYVTRSKADLRRAILNALTYGSKGGKQVKNGAIYKLLAKLEQTLDLPHLHLDPETLGKLVNAYLKLSALAITTAAQDEAIQKGISPVNQVPQGNLILVLENYLQERRQLMAQGSAQVIESTTHGNNHANLKALAANELSKRHANQSGSKNAQIIGKDIASVDTPPPGSGVGGGE